MKLKTHPHRLTKTSWLRIAVLMIIELPVAGVTTWSVFNFFFGVPDRATRYDTTALEVSTRDGPTPSGIIYDDAGRACAESDLQFVELRVKTDDRRYLGHTFIHTPNMTIGFQTNDPGVSFYDYLNPFVSPMTGVTCDDSNFPFDYLLQYRASPKTLRLLEESIRNHQDDLYQLGNWNGGKNCTTWARERLMDAGLTPPSGDIPNRIARYMKPARWM